MMIEVFLVFDSFFIRYIYFLELVGEISASRSRELWIWIGVEGIEICEVGKGVEVVTFFEFRRVV